MTLCDCQHKLDIYLPSSMKASLPVVVCVHGGGWMRGDRRDEWRGAPVIGRALATRGFVVVCPSYRLAPATRLGFSAILGVIAMIFGLIFACILHFPIGDSANFGFWFLGCSVCFAILLLTWIWCRAPFVLRNVFGDAVKHPSELKHTVPEADTQNQLFLLGHSAGAHLVSLLALDQSYLTAACATYPRICGVVSMSGLYRVDQPLADFYCHPMNCMFRWFYAGAVFEGDDWVRGSPVTHLHDDKQSIPPFLVMNGSNREFGLDSDGRFFAAALSARGHKVEYVVIEGCTHATISNCFDVNGAADRVNAFFYKCLDGESGPADEEAVALL
jgi:acetyl esterase/lipase